ncbi:MAG TPA: TlpA disulfide reductase family protein [Cyclobacteriaceae bacterium]|jgi:thiol-disulfide isomerase/thioredoxin|nr:TlpA family protein disulfide reductase [Cytophagales bacterium]HNT50268.1 TlpA disulfide reductase family protein [Cyclobacteriaceae bacterium]HRE66896.1 TlpA disulfide reductase family protein [Cyclobacteriaceae bacterium]HRF34235.1 TlpA disulfide reductase family protein [Cyclobacteriaceae bacterium]
MKRILDTLKPIVSAILLIAVLQTTGLLSSVSVFTRQAAMEVGFLKASPDNNDKPRPDFDYNFSIKDLNGNKISFEQFKGKVIFLNMWATWCGPCRAEMPGIQSLYDKVKSDSIEFVMLSWDSDSDKPKVEKYVEKKSFTFPVYQPSGYLPDHLQVPSIPTTFIISKAGKVIQKEVGTRNYDTKKMIQYLKAEAAK